MRFNQLYNLILQSIITEGIKEVQQRISKHLKPSEVAHLISQLKELPEETRNKRANLVAHFISKDQRIKDLNDPEIKQAFVILDKFDVDLNQFDSFDQLFDRYQKPIHMDFVKKNYSNPDTVKQFYDKKILKNSQDVVAIYKVDNSIEGMMAVRYTIDANWGYDANPWCLAARQDTTNDEDIDWYDNVRLEMTNAWRYWMKYDQHTKQIAFQVINGQYKLVGFFASDDYNSKLWWDRNDAANTHIRLVNGNYFRQGEEFQKYETHMRFIKRHYANLDNVSKLKNKQVLSDGKVKVITYDIQNSEEGLMIIRDIMDYFIGYDHWLFSDRIFNVQHLVYPEAFAGYLRNSKLLKLAFQDVDGELQIIALGKLDFNNKLHWINTDDPVFGTKLKDKDGNVLRFGDELKAYQQHMKFVKKHCSDPSQMVQFRDREVVKTKSGHTVVTYRITNDNKIAKPAVRGIVDALVGYDANPWSWIDRKEWHQADDMYEDQNKRMVFQLEDDGTYRIIALCLYGPKYIEYRYVDGKSSMFLDKAIIIDLYGDKVQLKDPRIQTDSQKEIQRKEYIQNFIEKYLILNKETGRYDSRSDVKISSQHLIKDGHLVIPFGVIHGNFEIRNLNLLTSLKNGPTEVDGLFDCSRCKNLISLQGAPQIVGRSFDCSEDYKLVSLKGGPKEVGGEYKCNYCSNLKSLNGAPKISNYGFSCNSCNSLVNLEGAPKEVLYGFFTCSYCPSLTSLEGAPVKVGTYFSCEGCRKLQSIKQLPKSLKGPLYIQNTPFKKEDVLKLNIEIHDSIYADK